VLGQELEPLQELQDSWVQLQHRVQSPAMQQLLLHLLPRQE
jgi:hypothetical protein